MSALGQKRTSAGRIGVVTAAYHRGELVDAAGCHSIGQEWVRFLQVHSHRPRIRLHDLRHAHATHPLALGVHPKVASERLGHSKVGITLDLYSHVLPNMQADAAAIVDRALTAALNKRK